MIQKTCKLFLVALLCIPVMSRAWQQDSLADRAATHEKIHIHTDRESYFPGETIWFKAYLVTGFLPGTKSTDLYVDLLGSNGQVLQNKIFPIIDATADGSFLLPDSLSREKVIMRAYTRALLHNDPELIYHKYLSLFVKKPTETIAGKKNVSLVFFPEGGNMVNDVINRVAFKATFDDGMPFPVNIIIKNSKGIFLDSTSARHNGMGVFSLTPEAGEQYYASWRDQEGTPQQTILPRTAPAIALHTEQVNKYLYYTVQNPAPGDTLSHVHITAVLHQKIIYTADLDMSGTPVITGRIPVAQLPAGILQVTAYNKYNMPVAERINFINNNNIGFEAGLTIVEKDLSKRGKTSIDIDIPDTLAASLSLSVYDADVSHPVPATNIYSDLLLSSDIKGYIHEPAWYFADTSLKRKQALDLVMQTNGWRRYRNDIIPEITDVENYITITGSVTDQKKAPQAGQSLTLMVKEKDSVKQFYTVRTDLSGRFRQSGLLFSDSATVWYQLNKSTKKVSDLQVNMLTGFLPLSATNKISLPWSGYGTTAEPTGKKMTWIARDSSNTYGQTLAPVTVRARSWRTNPVVLMDDKYATGIFRGNATSFAFDVLNDPMAGARFDVLNYVLGKVPGLSLGYAGNRTTGGFKTLLYRQSPLTLLFIDEQPFPIDPTDPMGYTQIQNLNMEDIAYIKFFTKYPLNPDKAALSIYLKKGDEIDPRSVPGLPKVKLAGYTSVKEFYSPNYAVPDAKHSAKDVRNTLYWKPYIITGKDNHKVTVNFYNNDVSSSFYVVLEGMNENGKLVHIQKTVTAAK